MSSAYSGNVASGVQAMGEPLLLVQESLVFDTATQTSHVSSIVTTSTYGIAQLNFEGMDGVEIIGRHLTVWLAMDLLATIVPKVGNQLVLGTSKFQILQLDTNNVMGYYKALAKGV